MATSDERLPDHKGSVINEASAPRAEDASSSVDSGNTTTTSSSIHFAPKAQSSDSTTSQNTESSTTASASDASASDVSASAAPANATEATAAAAAGATAASQTADDAAASVATSAASDAMDTTAVGAGSTDAGSGESGDGEPLRARRRRRRPGFTRSLQFRITVIFAIVGLISTACMGVMSYMRVYDTTQDFVDEELSQIASVAINYRMIIPRRWEAPRQNHERVLRMMSNGRQITIEYSTGLNRQHNDGYPPRGHRHYRDGAVANNGGAGAGVGSAGNRPESSAGMRHGAGAGGHAGQGRALRPGSEGMAGNNVREHEEEFLPSISDLHRFKYDIIIAPLFGRPGDALYIPPGATDGFYTLLVEDQRVRAFISTNSSGQRFVVARPLSSIDTITRQALINSIYQFLGINLLFIPLLIISVKMMFITLNKIARLLYRRSEDDLSPIISDDHRGFVPSELDGFILALNKLFSKVDDGIQSKRRFIADAAHEMRTPLTALSLQAESLEKESLSPEARAKVERLKEGISRERELMTALLTLAREQSKASLMHETIDVFELYLKLIDEQEVLADRKFIDLGVEGNARYKIVTDRMRLTRIMSNLLSNAIKYTPEGGRIDLMANCLDDGRLELIVQDDGPGIPPEQMEHILEPFYRVHGDRSEQVGTGLGLAIVKASCDSINAKLSFKNAEPHGLIATVVLPPLNDESLKKVDKTRLLLPSDRKR